MAAVAVGFYRIDDNDQGRRFRQAYPHAGTLSPPFRSLLAVVMSQHLPGFFYGIDNAGFKRALFR